MKPAQLRSPGNRVRPTERGTILIIVLWVSLGLVTVTLLFGHAVMLSFRAADNTLAGRQAAQAVEGGLRYAAYLLANLETPGQLPEATTYAREFVPVGEGAFWFLSRTGESGPLRRRAFALNDECAKLNLNTATLEMLEGLPGMTAQLAAAIIDWRDEDEEATQGGAESQYYSFLEPPYRAKNAPFETVEELRWVAGATWSVLYGEDANRNGLLDENEDDGDLSWPPDNRNGLLDEGVVDYLTVYSREPNLDSDGSPRLNVNSAREELATLFEETFGEDRARELQQQLSGVQNVRSVLEFYLRSGLTADEFVQVEDRLTVSDESFLPGLINVNTASQVVLACLPGMDESKAANLVAHRQGNVSERHSLAWVTEVLDEDTVPLVGPHLTARSYQVNADVVGVGRLGRGYHRVQAVFDLTADTPQLVYRKDLSGLGWALGLDIMEQLAAWREITR